jgi:hypothetical protein
LLLFSFLLARKKRDIPYWLLLFGVRAGAGAAYYIRTTGIALWLALLCTLLTLLAARVWKNRQNTWRQHFTTNKLMITAFVGIAAFFLLCKAPWDARNKQQGTTSSYMSQLTTQLGGTKITDFHGWVERVEKNTVRYITKEIPSGLFVKTVTYETPANWKGWLFGILALLVIIFGMFQLKSDNLLLLYYTGGMAAILLFWPDIWFSPRFMSSLIPLLLLFVAMGLIKIAVMAGSQAKIKNISRIKIVALLALLLCLYPNYTKAIAEAKTTASFKDYTPANSSPPLTEYLDAIRWVKDNLPAAARVSTRKPELFYVYSGGRKSTSFPTYAPPEKVLDYLTANKIEYVIIDRWFRHAYATVMPAVQTSQDKFKIVYKIGGAKEKEPPTYVLQFNPRWGYTGDMKDGQRHGQGVLVLQDGRTYTGSFVNGATEGYGVMTDANGNVIAKGIWKDNNFVQMQ